ncbi:3-hydroxyacyl-CoA dehydrogenase NAD-binding domain-containing protein [Celeribacter persicus]|uniref:Short chain enoyl-CoA hydratase /3-hydroxyacyl-CoA dehydrogenase n=1 Tax=Celeribacter persicus TaxID=1651082 RepID=A0A2T5HGM2_9RHOB|nr:3-hydroxyacyl-CoA dehydrogenase NAD-binding domain-containing protein [Celeribacter persicus]PTQ70706.1 short chain enoyl-CoA hydratase /3-hydroxyacyl-CoA dehydrogenase [Celeribacter persicus]
MSLLTCRMDGEIAVLTLDNPPVNAISADVRQSLVAMVAQCDADDTVRAVVLCCAGRTFISGADVREFGQEPVPPHLPDVVQCLEQAQKPWIAAIHGAALGGGFEIAMGCRFRVSDAEARVGLPEVTLGVMPGASGTVRTPRLAGLDMAVEMVTTGMPIKAHRAKEVGLIDAVIEGDLVAGAVAFAREALSAPLPLPVSQREMNARDESYWQAAIQTASKAGHHAPLRALESLRFASEHSFEEAMAHEREGFLALRASEEAKALRAVFFAERRAVRPEALKHVAPRSLSRIGVVGGGTMGAGIASACRSAGLPVVLVERDQEALARGLSNVDATFAGAVKRGKMSEAQRAELMVGITGATDYAALGDCDLVIEAVFEEIGVKRAVFAELDRHCRQDTVLATNTSYLDPRDIAEGLSHPERFIGLHFFSPAQIMKLLEIVPVPETAPEVLATAFALGKRLGKVPVQSGICEGFIGNRILKRYRSEAEALVREGVSIQAIDTAMRDFGFRMGPFEAQDLGGLDIAFLQREGARASGRDVPETLGDVLVRAGRKGQKTGGGWYDYAPGERRPTPSAAVTALLAVSCAAPRDMPSEAISAHLVGVMADEGQRILAEGISGSASDIDLVEIHGYGFPRWRGGPMHWAAQTAQE